ncbi:CWC25 Pre-mRNA-splicing factor CWC25 [Candida maltosa Xu316]|uniref:Pre-mRNA-splicing factor CWC25 n=1 Tax=Candida maltosa (strain Xu316) TaxID=1245528 RepID=M3JVL2_CANMX|nr:Pre-mRNA-splicing factor CWC25 [Candida maltosa Xu316]
MAGDLNLKKSWNPALVKNRQKVWEEEQQKLDELKKIKEKNHEYKQEQEYLQLLKLQYGDKFNANDLNKSEKLKLSKLNWMYDDVPFENNEQVEENSSGFIESSLEFTEGKSKVENLLNGNRAISRKRSGNDSSDRINKIIGVGMSKSSKSTTYSDDPLAKIKQKQKQQQALKSAKSKHSHRSRESSRHSSSIRKPHQRDRSPKR